MLRTPNSHRLASIHSYPRLRMYTIAKYNSILHITFKRREKDEEDKENKTQTKRDSKKPEEASHKTKVAKR